MRTVCQNRRPSWATYKFHSAHGRRWGGAVIELAITAPLLVMLTFGTIEYAYFTFIKTEVLNAANCGAQEASLSTSTNTTVQAAVDQAMQNSHLQSITYTVVTSPTTVSGVASGTTMSVTVSFPWSSMSFSPLPPVLGGISTNKQLTATASTRRQ